VETTSEHPTYVVKRALNKNDFLPTTTNVGVCKRDLPLTESSGAHAVPSLRVTLRSFLEVNRVSRP
jgi:hypothetical protein